MPNNIRRLSRQDSRGSTRWDEFVERCADASFFHRAGWQAVIEDVFKHDTHFLYAQQDERIEGVLPLVHVRSMIFGNALVSLPFAVYGGVASCSDWALRELEQEAQALAQRLGVDHLELRNRSRRRPDWPEQDLYVTFRKAILESEDANMLAIPRKQRAMVRKGIKNGLNADHDIDTSRFFDLYADNMLRHGTPALPKRYFDALASAFGGDCRILTVTDTNHKPISSVLSFYFKNEVLPYYAGDDEAARDSAANDFKYWELMRRSCDQGIKVFDYGRSKLGTGSYAFKKNWGFEPEPLHYEYCLYKRDAVPQNNPTNAKYRLMIEAWKRLPIGVANWLGPKLVRSLG